MFLDYFNFSVQIAMWANTSGTFRLSCGAGYYEAKQFRNETYPQSVYIVLGYLILFVNLLRRV